MAPGRYQVLNQYCTRCKRKVRVDGGRHFFLREGEARMRWCIGPFREVEVREEDRSPSPKWSGLRDL